MYTFQQQEDRLNDLTSGRTNDDPLDLTVYVGTLTSSTAIPDIMVDDDNNSTFDGILIKILEFVDSSSEQDNNDNGMTTIMPRKSQDYIIICTLVSKRFHKIISEHFNIIPVLTISPPRPPNDSYESVLFNNIENMSCYNELQKKQHICHIIIKDFHLIKSDITVYDNMQWCRGVYGIFDRLRQLIELNGIQSLQITTCIREDWYGGWFGEIMTFPNTDGISLLRFLLDISPNVREIDLSNNSGTGPWVGLRNSVATKIETLKWNNLRIDAKMTLGGFRFPKRNNFKQIFMDNAVFLLETIALYNFEKDGVFGQATFNQQMYLPDNPGNVFIFYLCCKKLERVSIRNAKYTDEIAPVEVKRITQKALIKFVRNTSTTLRWFRSDLTPINIAELRKDYPKIEFLN